jgi:hypothetical protein
MRLLSSWEDLIKKVISLLVITAVFTSSVFSAPLSVDGSSVKSSGEATTARQTDVDLFAGISAPQLDTSEAEAVEGDGPAAVIAAVVLVTSRLYMTFLQAR